MHILIKVLKNAQEGSTAKLKWENALYKTHRKRSIFLGICSVANCPGEVMSGY